MVDDRYDQYCVVDPLFYDSLGTATAAARRFPQVDRPAPDGWSREISDDWLVLGPRPNELPTQGWKIHVSATLGNAERVLDKVWSYCVPRNIAFKFIRGPKQLLMRNAKYARRGSSGKFVTVYPVDEAQLELICKELGGELAGEPGPYVLSDLRWGDGPLYVRYGGFAARFCVLDGQVVPAVADPDGTLVPDLRDPVFRPPSWVELPACLAPHLAARNATTVGDLPYRIERVIHFSNGGGLYVAVDTRSGRKVVLKEARPHAGLDATGADAITRLYRERDALQRLAGLPQVPRVHDEFALGDHRFLALEFIEGTPLNRLLVQKYPLTDADADPAAYAEYTGWALDVYRQVEEAVTAIHDRDLVYGDLHLFNVLVRPDGSIALVDFEVAAPAGDGGVPALRNQAFAAPRDRTGFAVDRYALACLRLALFLPLTALVRLDTGKAGHLADVIASRFPVPRQLLARAVDEIRGDKPAQRAWRPTVEPDPAGWPDLRDRLAKAILASATPDRTDRLFPGDIAQFRTGGLNLAYGAAGVLHALAVTGAGRHPRLEEWLLERARTPESGSRLGFYDGLHGVAYALDGLGHRDAALRLLDLCLAEDWTPLGADLLGGLPGIGLNLLHFAAREPGLEPSLMDTVTRIADVLATRLSAAEKAGTDVSGGPHGYAGLTHGGAGAALFLLHLFEKTTDTTLLDRAASALRWDLGRCTIRPDGALEVNEGWRTMPYLAQGSVGLGLVLDRYLAHRPDEQFTDAVAAIDRAARSPFYAQSGLFAGRAGILLSLAARDTARYRVDEQVRALAWHAMPYGGGVAFPGEQLLRLSMDLATGTAGVLLALGAALHDRPVGLPFLTPPRVTTISPHSEGCPRPRGRTLKTPEEV